jgi:hypothetical protein
MSPAISEAAVPEDETRNNITPESVTRGVTRIDRIPGVSGPETCSPQRRTDARGPVEAARRKANRRDALDLSLLLAVDFLFASWESARVPLLDRSDTIFILLAVHLMVFGSIIAARLLPAWRARRVSSTWKPAEQVRFARAAAEQRSPAQKRGR